MRLLEWPSARRSLVHALAGKFNWLLARQCVQLCGCADRADYQDDDEDGVPPKLGEAKSLPLACRRPQAAAVASSPPASLLLAASKLQMVLDNTFQASSKASPPPALLFLLRNFRRTLWCAHTLKLGSGGPVGARPAPSEAV